MAYLSRTREFLLRAEQGFLAHGYVTFLSPRELKSNVLDNLASGLQSNISHLRIQIDFISQA